ncbi:YjfB family protein [Clostridium sp.]|uniref:YjfB family protein n=1 Tax=Clostridium sp. TaxID=1506 RepID=UPI001A4DEB16|nr:YjfB family protein [Clostridium sp.]MBK5240390.1 YjfB family protein [Clostridium sp.]
MDIGALSMIMSQSRVQQSVGIEVMKMAMNTGKENATQMTDMIDMIENVAIDSNVGQNLDVRA